MFYHVTIEFVGHQILDGYLEINLLLSLTIAAGKDIREIVDQDSGEVLYTREG